jgi:hypothetical protein
MQLLLQSFAGTTDGCSFVSFFGFPCSTSSCARPLISWTHWAVRTLLIPGPFLWSHRKKGETKVQKRIETCSEWVRRDHKCGAHRQRCWLSKHLFSAAVYQALYHMLETWDRWLQIFCPIPSHDLSKLTRLENQYLQWIYQRVTNYRSEPLETLLNQSKGA